MNSALGMMTFMLFPLLTHGQQSYHIDTTSFKNPERGFVDVVNSHRTAADSTHQSFWQLIADEPDSISVVFEEFVLHDFKTSNISQAYLDMMQAEFNNVRKYGMKAVVCFCYVTSFDWSQVRPPDTIGATISWMTTHIQQIQPVIRDNIDVIAYFHAGFIGRWGEWGGGPGTVSVAYPDYSRDTAAQAMLLTSLLSMLPANRMLDVRTPRYKLWYLRDETAMSLTDWWTGSPKGRIGQHNDAFHINGMNSGTFYDYDVHDTSFFRTWYKTETGFGGMVAEQGGEWNGPYDPSWFSDLDGWYYSFVQPMGRENAEMANQHIMTIGLGAEPWSTGMKARGLWNLVRRRLGYRIQLVNAEIPSSVPQGGRCHLRLTLTNSGWSSPRNPRGLELVLRQDSTGVETAVTLFQHKHPQLDPRLWWPGDTVQVDTAIALPSDIPPGTYSAFINLPDTSSSIKRKPHYSIRLANRNVWEPQTGYNNLGVKVTVMPAMTGTDQATTIPLTFTLDQNYPNPFNPTTTIRYELPKKSRVSLKVYSTLGQVVMTLVNSEQSAGRFAVELNGQTLASGVYFYRLQAGSFVETKKLALVR